MSLLAFLIVQLFLALLPDGKDTIGGVKLKDGTLVEADVVVLGIGAKPNTELLKNAGVELEKDSSVKVDGFLKIKGYENVYAIGSLFIGCVKFDLVSDIGLMSLVY